MEEVIVSTPQAAGPLPVASSGVKPAWGGWGQSPIVTFCSLEEVMSEELVEQLKAKEKEEEEAAKEANRIRSGVEASGGVSFMDAVMNDGVADTSSDLLIAQMLQHEMDTQHDLQLKREENKWNGTSKVKVTFDKFHTVHPALQADAEADYLGDMEVEELKEQKDSTLSFNPKGISGKGKNIVTKHDPEINSRKNFKKVMDKFPPGFETGDDCGLEVKLPNTVYNQLRMHSNVDNRRSQRIHEKKEHSTAEMAVDEKTRLIMYKLVNQGVLNEISGVISAGKESVVFHAHGGSIPNEVVPAECALKVFKTTLAEFRTRCQYVRGDTRFFKDEFKKLNPRKIMRIWAEKEELNLKRMKRFGIPCPTPVLLKKHILIMDFLGADQVPAPILKEAALSTDQLQIAYDQCVEHIKTLYRSCLLVHADLSEYNMLWHDERVYIIDVAQAVDTMHPKAMEFLLRDCANVSDFFKKRGVSKVLNGYELFNDVTGLAFTGEGREFLANVERYEKDERTMKLDMSRTDFPFDFFFAKAVKERQTVKKDSGLEAGDLPPTASDESEGEEEEEKQEEEQEEKQEEAGWEHVDATELERDAKELEREAA